MRIGKLSASVVVMLAVVSMASARAQSTQGPLPSGPVTAADIAGLETTADAIGRQASALGTSNPTLAADVTKRLADLRDVVTYLKVKLGKEGVTRAEFNDLHDKLGSLRVRATGETVRAQPFFDMPAHTATLPVGTELTVRLLTPLTSGTAKADDRFDALTILNVKSGAIVVIPAGSAVHGFVGSVRASGRIEGRQGSLTLSFDEIIVGAEHARLRASVEDALDGKASPIDTQLDMGTTVGAMPAASLGQRQEALVGVIVIGGGTIASTEGADVNLAVGTVLRLRLDQPLSVTLGSGDR